VVVVAEPFQGARVVAVVHADTAPRVVHRRSDHGAVAPLVGDPPIARAERRAEAQPALGRLGRHPGQRRDRQAVVGIAATDVGVHPGEPHLRDPLVVHMGGRVVARFLVFGPQEREERLPLVVECQRVTGAADPRRDPAVLGEHRPDPALPAARQFVHRQPVGSHGVPDAEELDVGPQGARRIERRLAAQRLPGRQEPVTHPAAELHRPRVRETIGAVRTVGPQRQPTKLGLAVGLHESDVGHQRGEHPGGVGPAAEAERVDAVATRRVVGIDPIRPAQEHVEVEDVPLQAVAEGATEDRQGLEPRSAHAVVVQRHLVAGGEVEGLVEAPDVGLLQLGGAVARAVGQGHEVPGAEGSRGR
jgi:hypothetical protein